MGYIQGFFLGKRIKMKKRLTKEQWNELINKINSNELNITEGSKIFKVSRMQIHRKLKEDNKVIDRKQEILNEVIDSISRKQCIICRINLDSDLNKKDWRIPLCNKHRSEYLSNKFKGMYE